MQGEEVKEEDKKVVVEWAVEEEGPKEEVVEEEAVEEEVVEEEVVEEGVVEEEVVGCMCTVLAPEHEHDTIVVFFY